jgi:hypothetical protein
LPTNFLSSEYGVIGTASSTSGAYHGARAFDGDDLTDWRSSTLGEAGAWLRAETNIVCSITYLRILQSSDTARQAWHVQVAVSDDAITWQVVGTYPLAGAETFITIPYSSGRFFRFTGTRSTSWWGWTVFSVEGWGGLVIPVTAAEACGWLQGAWNDGEAALACVESALTGDLRWVGRPLDLCAHDHFRIFAMLGALCQAIYYRMETMGGGGGGTSYDDTWVRNALTTIQTQITNHDLSIETMILNSRQTTQDAIDGAVLDVISEIAIHDSTMMAAVADLDTVVDNGFLANTQLHLNTRSTITNYIDSNNPVIAGYVTAAQLALEALMALIAPSAISGVLDVLGDDEGNILSAISGLKDYSATLQQIIDLLTTLPSNPVGFPGLDGVTMGTPVIVTSPMEIAGPLDGVVIEVQATAPGQSRQLCGDLYRYKGAGWVAFKSDTNHYGPMQAVQWSLAVICCPVVASPTAISVYCKPGTTLRVTPWTKATV